MSKSRGNYIDPPEILDNYGAESFRLWAVSEGNLDQKDFKCSAESVKAEQKTLNKLWNVSKFVSLFKKVEETESKFNDLDLLLKKEINSLVKEVDSLYNKYDFHMAIMKTKSFLWTTFSSHYLELVKNRAYNENEKYSKQEQNGAIDTLRYALEKLLYLFYPIIPFTTNRILDALFEKDILTLNFPETEDFESSLSFEDVETLNNSVWKFKKENNLSLKDSIENINLLEKYKVIENDN